MSSPQEGSQTLEKEETTFLPPLTRVSPLRKTPLPNPNLSIQTSKLPST